jgi:hypothetical protein
MVILLVIAAVIVLLVAVVATRPSDFRVTRSTAISAPPAVVFAQVNDFHNWDGWSPWARMDSEMKATYAGPAAGTGAVYSWVGNNKVGEGRMTIMESHPSDLVRIKLEFIKPFAATNTAEFTFQPQGNQTTVTWNMTGKKNFMTKAMGLVMNMDKMIGGQFDQGLAQMKSVAETAAKK